MRIVDLDEKTENQRITVLSYGAPRSGKTRFAGTFPRPLFLADASESGWNTLRHMNPIDRYEDSVKPQVWSLETATDITVALSDAKPLIDRGDVKTIVIDSLTFYGDSLLNYLDTLGGGRTDPRQLYGQLGTKLRNLRIAVHALPVNVVWLCLEKPPGDGEPVGGPLLAGSSGPKFAAGCDYIFFHRSFQAKHDSPPSYEIRTRKWSAYQAGGRDEGKLTDPLGVWIESNNGVVFQAECSYRAIADSLDLH